MVNTILTLRQESTMRRAKRY